MRDRFAGLLLGSAVGDSLGLPAEGLSPTRKRRLFGSGWEHRLLPGRGLVSDDTEHAFLTAQVLLGQTDVAGFRSALAWRVRLWVLGLPAGVGFATLRSGLRLWLGVSPERSGVYSAGNGPAMRAHVIGAFYADDPVAREAFVRASTRMTHTDPRALTGARAIAEAAAWAITDDPESPSPAESLLERLSAVAEPGDEDWLPLLGRARAAYARRLSVAAFAEQLGLARGVTGYIHHTVPVVLYALLRHRGSFRETLEAVLDCGGDADTTGAIVGALAGAMVGEDGIPEQWVRGVADWPLSTSVLRRAGHALAAPTEQRRPVSWAWPVWPLRNLVLMIVVLAHGVRRLFPPYA